MKTDNRNTPAPPKPDVRIIPAKRRISLNACPVGLFLFNGTLAVMTEYSSEVSADIDSSKRSFQRDAYIVESGEYFWGGVSTGKERAQLLVTPCDVRLTTQGDPH